MENRNKRAGETCSCFPLMEIVFLKSSVVRISKLSFANSFKSHAKYLHNLFIGFLLVGGELAKGTLNKIVQFLNTKNFHFLPLKNIN
jgi:hypothetical protein